jgi:hypothetical protein
LPEGNSVFEILLGSIMIIDNFLLPRFLILELVFACHYLQFARVCTILCGGTGREGVDRFEEAVNQVDSIDNRLEKKHKIVPKNQNWSHPPLLYNVSGLPILPLLSSKRFNIGDQRKIRSLPFTGAHLLTISYYIEAFNLYGEPAIGQVEFVTVLFLAI